MAAAGEVKTAEETGNRSDASRFEFDTDEGLFGRELVEAGVIGWVAPLFR